MASVPELRIRTIGSAADYRADGDFVLYWMVAARRASWNFGLQQAIAWASDLKKPLVVLEAIRCGYQWSSDRLHRFVIQGMADNQAEFRASAVTYLPYVEPADGEGRGLLAALAAHACVVVGDDFPCFFLPKMIESAARQVPVRFELVDSNGLLPMRATDRVFSRAYDFRRFLQRNLRPHLEELPEAYPLRGLQLPRLKALPVEIMQRWQPADLKRLLDQPDAIGSLPIDHAVAPTPATGGTQAAVDVMHRFLDSRLDRYADHRNDTEQEATSELSPYLHFGHLAAHQVFDEVMRREEWSIDRISEKANGSREGWWGASENVESFMDELITWREVGYNMCWQREDYNRYESLPQWARKSLEEHACDARPYVYELEQFEAGQTHNPLWNAAQNQLIRDGRIHNYLRMLWGKKILHWTDSPEKALEIMIQLNNKYALDGRNPNSYSGIFWVLGRYDRAWGPERPVFGKIRYMSSANTARKMRVKDYIRRYAEA